MEELEDDERCEFKNPSCVSIKTRFKVIIKRLSQRTCRLGLKEMSRRRRQEEQPEYDDRIIKNRLPLF